MGFAFTVASFLGSSFLTSLGSGGAGVRKTFVFAFVVFCPSGARLRGPAKDQNPEVCIRDNMIHT